MITFYTHFDENYRAQAATMIESLFKYASEPVNIVCLWLNRTGQNITGFGRFPFEMPNGEVISVVPLEDFLMGCYGKTSPIWESFDKKPWREFCWTLETALVNAAMQRTVDGDIAVYVDADSMFYSDPIPEIRESVGDGSSWPKIALTPHHFPPDKADRSRTAGIYNFGFGVFKGCELVRSTVQLWFDRAVKPTWEAGENNQTMLDDWPSMLGDQLIAMPRGFNVGPWQEVEAKLEEWDVESKLCPIPPMYTSFQPGSQIRIRGQRENRWHTLVSYHFHEFRRGSGKNTIELKDPNGEGELWNRTNYTVHPTAVEHVYKIYEKELQKWI